MSMSASAVCSNSGSFSGISSYSVSGDIWCPEHQQFDFCYVNTSGGQWVPLDSTYYPPFSPTYPTFPAVGTPCVPNPFTVTFTPLPECVLCDKVLEIDDKKLCKECKGVVEAWKFLSKKDEKEE